MKVYFAVVNLMSKPRLRTGMCGGAELTHQAKEGETLYQLPARTSPDALYLDETDTLRYVVDNVPVPYAP